MNVDAPVEVRCPSNLPACLDTQLTAKFLGLARHNIPVLVQAGLLKPLGHPAANGVKYFAAKTLVEKWNDEQWLAKAVDAITRHWQKKNARRSCSPNTGAPRTQLNRQGQPRHRGVKPHAVEPVASTAPASDV